MNERWWICERCGRVFDLEQGEGWIELVEDERSSQMGKLNSLMPYEEVCYSCADELSAIMEECNKECWNCEVTTIWGLSIMECLKLQLKFDLIELPQKEEPERGSLEEAREILRIFSPIYK
jgi:hypothetical protein